MQDRTFKGREGTYQIGRAVFLFSGSICKTFDEFRTKANSNVKGPDFISRLRGHIDVVGINPPKKAADVEPNGKGADTRRSSSGLQVLTRTVAPGNVGDEEHLEAAQELDACLIRRAIILRSTLENKAARIIDKESRVARTDEKLIRAFLQVKEYKHEVRSMEAVVEAATLYDNAFLVASLPPEDQLQMHVTEDVRTLLSD
jgi:hypothetical protein